MIIIISTAVVIFLMLCAYSALAYEAVYYQATWPMTELEKRTFELKDRIAAAHLKHFEKERGNKSPYLPNHSFSSSV